MGNKQISVDDLLFRYADQNGEQSQVENVYVAYKRIADYDECDCAKCCCCLQCCG